MFHSLLIIFFRNVRRNPGAAVINLLGLSSGLAAAVMIMLYIYSEIGFDRFHEKASQIFRVNLTYVNKDGRFTGSQIPAAVGPDLQASFPEIQSSCRLTSEREMFFQAKANVIASDRVLYADSTFFRLFSFTLTEGNQREVLSGIRKIVLSKKLAAGLFGTVDPIGKMVLVNGTENWMVSGITENSPQNSSIQFDALCSFETLYTDPNLFMNWDGGNQYNTYLLVNKDFDKKSFEQHCIPFVDGRINQRLAGSGFSVELTVEQLLDLHLFSVADSESKGTIVNLRIFAFVALFILLIACFNFTNMAAASAMYRARETGIRKVLGATRGMLIRQYLIESVLLTFLSAIIALLITEISLPYYNTLLPYEIEFFGSKALWFPVSFFLLVLITGLVSGLFPSWFLSSYQPVVTLKGGFVSSGSRRWLPRILVVFQFMIAAALLNSIILIYKQLNYIKHFDVGFVPEYVYGINLPGPKATAQYAELKIAFLQQAGIEIAGACSELPGIGLTMNGYLPEGYEQPVMVHVLDIEEGFLPVMGLKVIEGRGFDQADYQHPEFCMVNATYAKTYCNGSAVGKKIQRDGQMQIIGVVNDFHFASLHEPVKPLILTSQPYGGFTFIVLKINSIAGSKIVNDLEKTWRNVLPDEPFTLLPLTDYLQSGYTQEKQLAKVITGFTVLAVFIAVIGLLGLSSLILQLRTKELGIRKILGASHHRLIRESLVEFLALVVAGNLLALLPVWFLMDAWLSRFSYALPINVPDFVLTLLFTLLAGTLSVGWQAIRASRVKTIDIIKYE